MRNGMKDLSVLCVQCLRETGGIALCREDILEELELDLSREYRR